MMVGIPLDTAHRRRSVLFDHAIHQEPMVWDVSMLKTFAVGHFWHQLLQWAVVKA
jgi:hypothetical protein